MWFGEPHPSPKRSSLTRLSTSGQTRYKGWSRRTCSTKCWTPTPFSIDWSPKTSLQSWWRFKSHKGVIFNCLYNTICVKGLITCTEAYVYTVLHKSIYQLAVFQQWLDVLPFFLPFIFNLLFVLFCSCCKLKQTSFQGCSLYTQHLELFLLIL